MKAFMPSSNLAIPELEIDGYTIDEPDYREQKNESDKKNEKTVE